MIAVRDHLDQLGDALPVVVTFAQDPLQLAAYRRHLGVPFPVLADTERGLYHLVGAGRGSVRNVWSPGTLAMYARLMVRGRRLRLPTQDIRQLGADVVVDRDGRMYRRWLPPSPDARPSMTEIIAVVASLAGGRAD